MSKFFWIFYVGGGAKRGYPGFESGLRRAQMVGLSVAIVEIDKNNYIRKERRVIGAEVRV